jgi:hypothetical protein
MLAPKQEHQQQPTTCSSVLQRLRLLLLLHGQ